MAADTSPTSKRRQNRRQVDAEIMAAARDQLAAVGAAGLSLRSIARRIGMVSSAVYRYVESRDELLTRLIIEAYDSLGASVERAIGAAPDDRDLERWVAGATAVRAWALEQPHDYLLLYGSPVPGYAAPVGTAGPGTRVPLALASIVGGAAARDRLAATTELLPSTTIAPRLAADLERLSAIIELSVAPATLVAMIAGWTQMFGLVSFELTNQTRGIVDDHAGLFLATATMTGRSIGLR